MIEKQRVIERLFNEGHISFEEALVLQKDTVALPQVNMLRNLNEMFQIPSAGTVFKNQTDDKTI